MSAIYRFIAGGSRITPAGLIVAVFAAVLLHERGTAAALTFLAILVVTLAFTSFEKPT